MFVVKISGDKRVSRMTVNLGPEIEKMMNKVGDRFMKAVQRSAKMRAPKMTGALARSIKVKKGKKYWNLVVDSPYGRYQEMGFRAHFVDSSMPTKNSMGTIASAYGIPYGVTLLIHSQKGRFFVRDALQAQLPRLPEFLENSTKQAIKKAGG